MSAAFDTASGWKPHRIAVIGAGAMGSSLAGLLSSVAPVVMVCRNADRAAQIVRDGLRVRGLLHANAQPVVLRSVSGLRAIGGVSAVFVATKTNAIPDVAKELRPLLPDIAESESGVFVVSYQNGIDPGRQLVELLGDPRVVRMSIALGAVMDRDTGVVNITLNAPPHSIGSPEKAYTPACRALADLLTRAGIETRHDEQIEQRVWEKALLNAAMNPVAALVNSSVGDVLRSPARSIVEALLAEGVHVAQAEGMDLGEAYLDRAHALLEKASGHTPSMVDDIRGGRESEIGQLNRQIIEHGRRLGSPTPTHEIIDALIETFDWKVYQGAPASHS